jgi:dihydropyrimidinase
MRLTGWPVMTVSRGEVVCRDGVPAGAQGRGQFLPCALPTPAATRRGRGEYY